MLFFIGAQKCLDRVTQLLWFDFRCESRHNLSILIDKEFSEIPSDP
jgi:hypothetical protein